MTDITIERGRQNDLAPCACCGGVTRIVRGFVFSQSTARAVYFVRWTIGGQHDADVGVSIGGWCDADPTPRRFVSLKLRQLQSGPGFMVVDGALAIWDNDPLVGAPLAANEVRGTALAAEVFSILDAAGIQDERLHGWQLQSTLPVPN